MSQGFCFCDEENLDGIVGNYTFDDTSIDIRSLDFPMRGNGKPDPCKTQLPISTHFSDAVKDPRE